MIFTITVKVEEGQLEKALKKYKKILQAEGIIEQVKAREFYVKPSEKRRIKSEKARKRLLKKHKD